MTIALWLIEISCLIYLAIVIRMAWHAAARADWLERNVESHLIQRIYQRQR